MERVTTSQKHEKNKVTVWIHSGLTAALLFLGACEANGKKTSDNGDQLWAPVETYCPNYKDFVSVQPDGLWMFTHIEKNGDQVITTTIGNFQSQSEAKAECDKFD